MIVMAIGWMTGLRLQTPFTDVINSSNVVNFVKRMNEKMPELGGGMTLERA